MNTRAVSQPADHVRRMAAGLELALGRDGMDARTDQSSPRRPGRSARASRSARQFGAGCAPGGAGDRARADPVLNRWPVSRAPLAQSAYTVSPGLISRMIGPLTSNCND